jgi:hypothetical protein
MRNLNKLKLDLTNRYSVNVDEFLQQYEEGATTEVISANLTVPISTVKAIGHALQLRFANKYRADDLSELYDDISTLEQEETVSIRRCAQGFFSEALNYHGKRYVYFTETYKGLQQPMLFHCNTHGEFTQTPKQHLQSVGCPACASKDNYKRLNI